MDAKLCFTACLTAVLVVGCSGGSAAPRGSDPAMPMLSTGATRIATSSTNGRAGAMPAFYEGKLFTINFTKLPDSAAQQLIQHNKSINKIYIDEVGEGSNETLLFIAVINAVQEGGPGFNPLWREFEYHFNAGVTPLQFTSEDDILAAAAAHQITLAASDEVYRCSVLGPKK